MFKRSFFSKVCVIIILFAVLFVTLYLGSNILHKKAFADSEDINQICRYYTDSDKLVNSDGELLNLSIDDFKEKLEKVGINLGTEMPELAQIIPAQFLQKEETDKEYHYFGQEYGFMVFHDGDNWHVGMRNFK